MFVLSELSQYNNNLLPTKNNCFAFTFNNTQLYFFLLLNLPADCRNHSKSRSAEKCLHHLPIIQDNENNL